MGVVVILPGKLTNNLLKCQDLYFVQMLKIKQNNLMILLKEKNKSSIVYMKFIKNKL